MKKTILIFFVLTLATTGCQSTKTEAITGNDHDQTLNYIHDIWAKSIPKGKIGGLYSKRAVVFTHDFKALTAGKDISSYYKELFLRKNKSFVITPIKRVQVKKSYIYEVGEYNINGSGFSYLIFWVKEADEWKKDLEVIAPNSGSKGKTTEQVDIARKKWVDISINNDPRKLVEEVYADQCYYFTKGKFIDNKNSLIQEYSYMESMWVDIEPEFIHPVNKDLVYEIGKYNTANTYFGYYILVWNKDATGNWKVFLDANN